MNNPGTNLTNPAGFGVVTSQFVAPNRTSGAGSRWIQLGLRVEF